MTVGELRKELEGVPDGYVVDVENAATDDSAPLLWGQVAVVASVKTYDSGHGSFTLTI